MTLLNRQFLSAWVSVSSDPETYGEFTVLRLPNDNTEGPVQVQNKLRSTDDVAENRTLLNNPNITVRYGNLLTLPVADGLLYVEPIYIEQKDANAFPQLARVLVYFGGSVGFEPTLEGALNEALGAASPTPDEGQEDPPPDTGTPTPPPPDAGENPEVDQAARDIESAFQAMQSAAASGDYVAEGQAKEDLEAAKQRLLEALGLPPSTQPSSPPAGDGG
jgi:uncharacterized membrane protein (UPF0182 family)